MRKAVRTLGLALARAFGSTIRDCRTGEVLGRGLIVPWRGRIHVIGLETAVRAIFRPQTRLTYWKQEIVFVRREDPDFPSIRSGSESRGR